MSSKHNVLLHGFPSDLNLLKESCDTIYFVSPLNKFGRDDEKNARSS